MNLVERWGRGKANSGSGANFGFTIQAGRIWGEIQRVSWSLRAD